MCEHVSLCDLSLSFRYTVFLSILPTVVLLGFFIKQCTLDIFTNQYKMVCCANWNNFIS